MGRRHPGLGAVCIVDPDGVACCVRGWGDAASSARVDWSIRLWLAGLLGAFLGWLNVAVLFPRLAR
jgi:hypothetical protein